MKFNLIKLCVAIGALSMSMAVNAGPITWGDAQNSKDYEDVSINGSGVDAVNLTKAGGTTSVNGVIFTNSDAILPKSSALDFLDGNTTGDSAYDALLTGLDYGGGASYSFDIDNLIVGLLYELQVWFTDLRDCCSGRTMSYGDGATSIELSASTGASDSTLSEILLPIRRAISLAQSLARPE